MTAKDSPFLLYTLLAAGMVVLACTIAILLQAWVARARLTEETPQVRLDGASLFGLTDGSVESFLGIPFAEPP